MVDSKLPRRKRRRRRKASSASTPRIAKGNAVPGMITGRERTFFQYFLEVSQGMFRDEPTMKGLAILVGDSSRASGRLIEADNKELKLLLKPFMTQFKRSTFAGAFSDANDSAKDKIVPSFIIQTVVDILNRVMGTYRGTFYTLTSNDECYYLLKNAYVEVVRKMTYQIDQFLRIGNS